MQMLRSDWHNGFWLHSTRKGCNNAGAVRFKIYDSIVAVREHVLAYLSAPNSFAFRIGCDTSFRFVCPNEAFLEKTDGVSTQGIDIA